MSKKDETNNIGRGFEYGVRHLLVAADEGLFNFLWKSLNLSPDESLFLLNLGSIYLNHKRLLQEVKVQKDDYLRVHTKPRRYKVADLSLKDLIVHEDDDFLVVNKPSSIPVHATVDNHKENLHFALSKYLGIDIYVTHRLDVPTCGLMVFAKKKSFQQLFNQGLVSGLVSKRYWALVHGSVTHVGKLSHYMKPSPRAPKEVAITPKEGWQACVLHIEEIKKFADGTSGLEILLETGRTHQIRAQLAAIGHPVVGDIAYGSSKSLSLKESVCLQSYSLDFGGRSFCLKKEAWLLE